MMNINEEKNQLRIAAAKYRGVTQRIDDMVKAERIEVYADNVDPLLSELTQCLFISLAILREQMPEDKAQTLLMSDQSFIPYQTQRELADTLIDEFYSAE